MEFDKSRVYTALNADELKIGSKIIVADTLDDLKRYVRDDSKTVTLMTIASECNISRFNVGSYAFNLAYLVSEPEEKKLVWTDLKIGDVIRKKSDLRLVVAIDCNDDDYHIGAGDSWLDDEDLEEWEKVEE